MRTSLILTVNEEMAEFLQEQPNMIDPSTLINMLFHQEIERNGVTINPALKAKMENDDVHKELELLLDEDTHAAG